MNDLEDITREKDSYSQGMDKMNEIFDEILPFKVFHDFQAEKHGGSHLSTLAGRFAKKNLQKILSLIRQRFIRKFCMCWKRL